MSAEDVLKALGPMSDERRGAVTKILASLEKLRPATPEAIAREGKEIQFKDIQPALSDMVGEALELGRMPEYLSITSEIRVIQASSAIEQLAHLVREVVSFAPTNNTIEQQRSIRDQVRKLSSQFEEQFLNSFRAYRAERVAAEALSKIDTVATELRAQAQEQLDNIVGEMSTWSEKRQDELSAIAKDVAARATEINSLRDKAKETLSAIQDAAGVAAVKKFAEVFSKEATANDSAAKKWLWTAVGLAVVILGVLGLMYWRAEQLSSGGKTIEQVVPLFLSKAIGISFLSVLFFAVLKNYSAQRHAWALNRHRANCLQAYEALALATENATTREAMLLAAGKAIFEAGDTGYIRTAESASPSVDMIRVVEQLSGPAGKP